MSLANPGVSSDSDPVLYYAVLSDVRVFRTVSKQQDGKKWTRDKRAPLIVEVEGMTNILRQLESSSLLLQSLRGTFEAKEYHFSFASTKS